MADTDGLPLPQVTNIRIQRKPLPLLPEEVWCIIWSKLKLADKIRVSQVCSQWRVLALNTPTLWSTLDLDAFEQLDHLIDRCGPLPLSVEIPFNVKAALASVHTPPSLVLLPAASLHRLANTLNTRYGQLSAIRIHFEDNSFGAEMVADFLAAITAFPALRKLQVTGLRYQRAYNAVSFVRSGTDFPALELLDVRGFTAPSFEPALVLPSVRELRCTMWNFTDFTAFLNLCPAACSVQLDVARSTAPDAAQDHDALRLRLSHITQLLVVVTHSSTEEGVISKLRDPARIEYGVHIHWPLKNPQHDISCLNVFDDVKEAVEVTCLINGHDGVWLKARDVQQHVRSIKVVSLIGDAAIRKVACQMWDRLSYNALAMVVVDIRLWPALLRSISVAPALQHIAIRFQGGARLGPALMNFALPDITSVLPALKRLVLEPRGAVSGGVVSPVALDRLLNSIDIARPRSLCIDIQGFPLETKMDDAILAGKPITVSYILA